MNRTNGRAKSLLLAVAFLSTVLFSCVKNNALTDTHQVISGNHWSYINKVQIPFEIADTAARYNIIINLRHTSDYKYSNIFFLIHIIAPDGKRLTERKEFTLALPDGEWLGKGSGNIYSYQLPYRTGYRFDKKGRYVIVLEQNMRDNPLREVTDAGLRLEIVNQIR